MKKSLYLILIVLLFQINVSNANDSNVSQLGYLSTAGDIYSIGTILIVRINNQEINNNYSLKVNNQIQAEWNAGKDSRFVNVILQDDDPESNEIIIYLYKNDLILDFLRVYIMRNTGIPASIFLDLFPNILILACSFAFIVGVINFIAGRKKDPTKKYCENCWYNNEEFTKEDKYCPECGSKLKLRKED
jgi:hypothetical protein